ncbi:hypothetical protein [Methanothermobacter tenebrarum]|uniref:PsbP C-terminal domain-containing protein n=1 Tax=Methanothermobacter tenebrarum TaxID=680118 RepID=A0A328PEU5_9EURY|nr:hypothetical protein [Methanothermobacter tenebrarum]MBC7118081.1 hypothetical protein [Methanobacteriaceae archaeon]NPV64182.1 hypothetical protein [Methanobacteriaceae archaeon]RAO79801.1 hypothetical protein DPC56_00510 [Methanothermobacter tenebrarum]
MPRKHLLVAAGLIIIFLIIFFKPPGDNKPKTFSKDNVSFVYPADWEEAPSLTYPADWGETNVTNVSEELGEMLNYSMFSVRDTHDKKTRFDVLDVGSASSLEELVNFYKSARSGKTSYYKPNTGLMIIHEGSKIDSENSLTINGMRAYQIISTSHSGKYKYVVIFIEKIPGEKYYQIVFSCKIEKFEEEKKNFEFIINSLKIT